MKDYCVGQILFLIANNNVIPVQIIEEVIRTTLSGKEKTYIVKFPDKDGSTSDINKIKGDLFSSQEEVRKFMIDNATTAINAMISKANEITSVAFDKVTEKKKEKAVKQEESKKDQNVHNEKTNDIIKVDLGNGKFGKIKTKDFEKAGELK